MSPESANTVSANPASDVPAAATDDVSLSALVDLLVSTNKTLLGRFITLVEQIESDLINAATSSTLQGETEELLRILISRAGTSIGTMLTMQSNLQLQIVERFFPVAQ